MYAVLHMFMQALFLAGNHDNHKNGVASMLKEVAFIAGKSENQEAKKKFIRFFIDNLIANIRLYALSWPKLNFGCYLTFEIIF